MMAPTPSYQHIWECDAEFFSVGGEPFRDDVEEEKEEKAEDDEEGTVKEDNKEVTTMKRQP